MIRDNILEIKNIIKDSCDRVKRDPSEVTLIDVSKTKPVEMVMEAYEVGERDFGENKVQELVSKYEQCPKDIRWHMIGHLQRNKVKMVIDKAFLIHSVDSLRLAQCIQDEAQKIGKVVNILLEINVAEEESKFGLNKDEVIAFVKEVAKFPNVHVCGLMTVAPYTENAEDNRVYFRILKQLSVDINEENIDNVDMNVLSMGMSGDYPIAIEEGATYVRIGTSIFGFRDYKRSEQIK